MHQTEWWVLETELPDLIWARLQVFSDGTADVLDCDARTTTFSTVEDARNLLLEDEFVRASKLDADDLLPLGLTPGDLVPPRDGPDLDPSDLQRYLPSSELRRDFAAYTLRQPWSKVGAAQHVAFEEELAREVGAGHPLFRRPVRAIARRLDRDDVLFVLEEPAELAVVHLTYFSRAPERPPWPATTFYGSAHDFFDAILGQKGADDAG